MPRYPFRRPTRRRLTFRIFNIGVRFRLDSEGRALPCSLCRIPSRENLWETFCFFCLDEFDRDRDACKPKPGAPISPMTGLPFEPAPEFSETCVRCRAPLGDDDDCWHCQRCLIALAARRREKSGVQLPLNFNPCPRRLGDW